MGVTEARASYLDRYGTLIGFDYREALAGDEQAPTKKAELYETDERGKTNTRTGEDVEAEPIFDLTKAIADALRETEELEIRAEEMRIAQALELERLAEIRKTKELAEASLAKRRAEQLAEIEKTRAAIDNIHGEMEETLAGMGVDEFGNINLEVMVPEIVVPEIIIPEIDLGLPSATELKIGGAILVLIVLGIAVIAVAT